MTQVIGVNRDYWQMEAEGISDSARIVVRGRQRTTESFWEPGLSLPAHAAERLLVALENAATIVTGLRHEATCSPMFPHYDLIAICSGAWYCLQILQTSTTAGTVHGVIVYALEPMRPVLWLTGEDVREAASDLQQTLEALGLADA